MNKQETQKHLIKALLSTDQYYGLFIYGEGGLGKTVTTMQTVHDVLEPHEYTYSNGYMTSTALYQYLWKHKDKKLIILDDVEGLLTCQKGISLLKAALWDVEGTRRISYHSAHDMGDVPDNYIVTSKIIILANKLPNAKDGNMKALRGRTMFYNCEYSFEEKRMMLQGFLHTISSRGELKTEEYRLASDILQNCCNQATEDFNFRTLRKLIALVKYNPEKAETLFRETTQQDETLHAYYKSIKLKTKVGDQVRLFSSLTGLSRRTFYRLKKEHSKR